MTGENKYHKQLNYILLLVHVKRRPVAFGTDGSPPCPARAKGRPPIPAVCQDAALSIPIIPNMPVYIPPAHTRSDTLSVVPLNRSIHAGEYRLQLFRHHILTNSTHINMAQSCSHSLAKQAQTHMQRCLWYLSLDLHSHPYAVTDL